MSASTFQVLLIVVTLVVIVLHAQNVSAFTTRSYDLQVPGSKPIRIIEADPGWDVNRRPLLPTDDHTIRDDPIPAPPPPPRPYTHRGDRDDRFTHPDFEHRTTRPDIISDRNDKTSVEINEENSEKLKQFLSRYAQNLNKNPKLEVGNIEDVEDELVLKDKFDDEVDEDDIQTEGPVKPEKSKSWNLLHFEKLRPGQQDHKGWVTMDAVPWSVSKISKWHGKPNKNKYQNNYYDELNNRPSYNDRFHAQEEYPRPTYPKPSRPNNLRPSSGYYDDVGDDEDIEDPVEENYYNKRPSFMRPTATYGHKVNVQTVQSSYGSPNNRPHQHDDFCNQKAQTDIITDGMPSNFPDHEYGNRRRGVASDTLPSTHPFKGDGEWVILSTTKGYKYPKSRQRSIQFTNALSENAIESHKSVRLTVLPPLNNGKVNMTTSHGGLLQVDASFQTVEDAQKAFVKKQKLKNRHPGRRPNKRHQQQLQSQQQQSPPKRVVTVKPPQVNYQMQTTKDNIVDGSSSDASAVLAAVGAGMIPAGMALLVPMAMSGKRRRRDVDNYRFITASPFREKVELTLPSSVSR